MLLLALVWCCGASRTAVYCSAQEGECGVPRAARYRGVVETLSAAIAARGAVVIVKGGAREPHPWAVIVSVQSVVAS